MSSKKASRSSENQKDAPITKTSGKTNKRQASDAGSYEANVEARVDPGMTDYIPQSVVATHSDLYPDMDFGATGTYGLPGFHPVAGNRVRRRHRLTASVISPANVDIQEVLEQDEVLVHLTGRDGNPLSGTAGFHVKSTAPSCAIEIKLKGTTKTTGPLNVDAAP